MSGVPREYNAAFLRDRVANHFSDLPPDSASTVSLTGDDGVYRSLTETIPVQIWTATPDGRLDYVSEQTIRVLGRPAEKMLLEGWQSVVHPEDLPLAIERWSHSLKSGDPYETEFRLRVASGEYHWYLARAVPQLNSAGDVVRWFGTNTDIEKERRQQRRIQALLSKLEEQTSQLTERNQHLALEVEFGSVLGGEGSLDELLADALQLLVKHFHILHCSIWLSDGTGESFQWTASAGAEQNQVSVPKVVVCGQDGLGQMAVASQPTVLNAHEGDSVPGASEWTGGEKAKGFVASPLTLGKSKLGLIGVWTRTALSKEAIAAIGSITRSLSQAIERHRALERIRLSEIWLSTILSSIGDGVIATDAVGRISYMNVVAEQLTRWTADEAIGLHLDEIFCIVNEESRQPVESPVAKVLREGVVVGMANHTILLRRDDTELSVEDSTAPILALDGTLNGIVLVFRDASEARTSEKVRADLLESSQKSQREAKEARDHLHALFMQAPAPICVLRGKDHVFELANPPYLRMVAGREMLGLPVRTAVPELVGQGVIELLDQVFATGERFEGKEVPLWFAGATGELGEQFLDFVYEPLRNHQGEVEGILILATDVTEKVKARHAMEAVLSDAARLNQELSETQSILRSLVDNLPELAWSARPDGHLDFYNRRWYEYTGTTAEEMVGWGWTRVHDPDALESVIERWKHSIATGERFEMEFRLRGADGIFRWFLTRVEPLRDSSGKVVRWFGTNTDIHRQREEGQKAMEANMAKDEFLATASHELRNPLSAILGWARLLRSGEVAPDMYARGLETIERNANAQVQLIEDILDGSRIMTGNMRLEVGPLDLIEVVRSAIETVRTTADAKKILITTHLDPMAARMIGDAERLQQIVWNLTSNAVKFTDEGGTVDVRLERLGACIQLSVTDSGKGIDCQFLPHVFDRFRQADTSPTRRHGGLGLGLALVQHLAEAHGGSVHAESEGIGKGSRFVVRLPVQALYIGQEEVDDEPSQSSHNHCVLLEGVKILVVDDEVDGRELVTTMLRMQGAKVKSAGGAEEALQLFRRSGVDVIVSDIGMPEIDGYELIRRIRGLSGEAGVRVRAVALTAYAREKDRRLALEAGFQAHLAKPVEPRELIRVVAELFEEQQRATNA